MTNHKNLLRFINSRKRTSQKENISKFVRDLIAAKPLLNSKTDEFKQAPERDG